MDYIYLACIDRIKSFEALFQERGLKPIQHFDFFKNQYIYPELHHIYKKPALFFEYRVNWRDRDRLVQKGEASLRFHLEIENYAASFEGSKNQETALRIFKYHRLLKGILHGFRKEGTVPRLVCVGEEPDLNPTTTNVHILTFECTVVDDVAEQIAKLNMEEAIGEELALTRVAQKDSEPNQTKYNVE